MNRLQGSLITEIFGAKVPKKSDLGFPWDQFSRFGFTLLIFSDPLILAVHRRVFLRGNLRRRIFRGKRSTVSCAAGWTKWFYATSQWRRIGSRFHSIFIT
jgi:hypothetical protein